MAVVAPNSAAVVLCVCVCARVCVQERNAAAKGKLAAMISQQPMFCFETAVKLFFFSSFVYSDYNGVRQWQCGHR